MVSSSLQPILELIRRADVPSRVDIEAVLCVDDDGDIRFLLDFADRIRREVFGDGVLLRGIIEFSNHCRNTCLYCGLNRANLSLHRYRLTGREILAAAEEICAAGVKTIVLQSGEEDDLDARWFAQVIQEVKSRFDVAITLSLGERPEAEYALWRQAGADRYLLKIETSNPELYEDLHPGMCFGNRIRCLKDLARLGYQTGSGDLVGLPGQTVETLAGDIQFLVEGDFDMISVSPFIPHAQTPLADVPAGDLTMTLKMIALARIVSPNAHMPASTAIGSLNGRDERPQALAAGTNVIMPNFTPERFKRLYEIYPGKVGHDMGSKQCVMFAEKMIAASGRLVDFSRGDSLKAGRSVALAGE